MTPAESIGNLLGPVTVNSAFDIFVGGMIVTGRSSEESELSNKTFRFSGSRTGGNTASSINGSATSSINGKVASSINGAVAGDGDDGTEDNTEDKCEGERDGSVGGETIFVTRLIARPRLACPTSLKKCEERDETANGRR
jgi:hypothetical protein